MVPRKLVVNPTVLRRLWLVILVNIATLFILHPAAYWGLIHAYMRDGFDAERATRWIPMREFGQASGLYAPPISLMYPLMIATTVVFPLCILLPHRRWWIALAVLWPLAFIGSVWRIAQYC